MQTPSPGPCKSRLTASSAAVNDKVKQHSRMVYSQQSQRHVAEQIESLHWNLATADSDRAELDTVVVRRDAELTDRSTVESLPEDYDDLHLHPDHETGGEDADKYNDLRAHLLELGRARDALRQKVAQYRHLRTLLEPLDNPQANIQPNLVTRDGELSVELDRMRILLARVTGRVSDMPKTRKMTPVTVQTDQQKLASLMEWT